ncbi:GTP cyclohydrolase II [Candidatus Parvarchaeota archaeon]|nr:GTP cyclohydrolase II [Candidatus Parvarchaeota archaeon]
MADVQEIAKGYYFKCKNKRPHIERVAFAKLPTKFGKFTIHAFCNSIDWKEHVAVVKGDVEGQKGVPVRVHSECLTGDVIASLKCDCRSQLEAALKFLGRQKCGALLYMRQEGRGIGLINKIRAYELQDRGLDTVDANLALGLPEDLRDYRIASEMIKLLGVRSIRLITNNPKKASELKKHGIKVSGRIGLVLAPTKYNLKYLKTKNQRMGHKIRLPGKLSIKTKLL